MDAIRNRSWSCAVGLCAVWAVACGDASLDPSPVGAADGGASDGAAEVEVAADLGRADADAGATDGGEVGGQDGSGRGGDAGVDGGTSIDAAGDGGARADGNDSDSGGDAAPVVAPSWPATKPLGQFYVTIRTGAGATDGTDDPFKLCLGANACWALDNAALDDRQPGDVDHYRLDAGGMTKAQIDRVALLAVNGTNAWRPTCVQVVADGELLFCQDGIDVKLSMEGGSELPKWQASNPGAKLCASCYPGGKLTHGPMVGHTTAQELRVWVQTGASWPLQVEVAKTAGFAQPIAGVAVLPAQQHGFMQVAAVTGLQADTPYWYRVRVDGSVAFTAKTATRTAPAGPGKVSIGFGSCSKHDAVPIYGAVAAAAPSLWLAIGDNHYGNTADLDAQRWWYRRLHAEPNYLALTRFTPTWAIWDDHDFVGNNTDGSAKGKDTALQVFGEAWANPSAGSGGAAGIWSQFTFGEVDVFLLDDRYWRGLQGSMLGQVQTSWLVAGLQASKARFKVVACGSQWTLEGSGDSWAEFPAAQKDLLAKIFAAKIGGVVLLSGDIHRSEVRQIVAAGAGKYPIYELTSSPLANLPSACKPTGGELLYCHAGNSFGLLTLDTTQSPAQLVHQVRDAAGKVLYQLNVSEAELQVK